MKLCKLLLPLALAVPATALPEDEMVFDVPRLEGIAVDGDGSEWGDRGLRIGVIKSKEGTPTPAADLDVRFRLGWDDEGLLLLLTVHDDVPVEHPSMTELWSKDSVELFASTEPGSRTLYQVYLGPGRDPEFPEVRRKFFDHREGGESMAELDLSAARSLTETGYVFEVLMPWANLDCEPAPGAEAGFQFYVNDSDIRDQWDWYRALWYPRDAVHMYPGNMHRLRLAEKAGPPVEVVSSAGLEGTRLRLDLAAVPELAGAGVSLMSGDRLAAETAFEPDATRASATVELPLLSEEEPYGTLSAVAEGREIARIELPDPRRLAARELMEMEAVCDPHVFSGAELPQCGPARPAWVEGLAGRFGVRTRYFDSGFREVTAAERPGRYGAVIEIDTGHSGVLRRYRTLFRLPEPVAWWQERDVVGSVRLPEKLGIAPETAGRHADSIAEYAKRRFVESLEEDARGAALLAGLFEEDPGAEEPVGPGNDVRARDRQWWVELKRRLQGQADAGAEPFVCPRPLAGEPAPVLRPGSAAEAGMSPAAVAGIDSLCRVWAEQSDQGFAVALARRGVLVLHEAYGMRDGRAMTVDDRSWMASITKLLSGTLMMMLVDQGLVDLDAPLDTYLASLRGIEVARPLTIRDLYIHTNGLWGHWGDDLHDFEEIVAGYYPYLPVREQHSYNGAGYALGGKVIEALTGEAIPTFYKRRLLDPLGCTNTHVTDTSGGAASVPADIARIAQMLLNRGAYGEWRFFSEETFAQMLPAKQVLSSGHEVEWGIGATWHKGDGLGESTFGHGAASAATLRIDPENELIVVMTRNSAGTRFSDFHPQFLEMAGRACETGL